MVGEFVKEISPLLFLFTEFSRAELSVKKLYYQLIKIVLIYF